MRLIFMGTPSFALPAFEALREAGHDIVDVYTQPPRPSGRGKLPKHFLQRLAIRSKGFQK